jgi:DNA-directed RNA polymerase sigma subunit (sigma70/sigma32)
VRVANQFGVGEAADRELAERLGVSLERVRSMVQRRDGRDVSLDAKVNADSARLLDRMPAADDQEQALFSRQFHGYMRGALADAVAQLDARERYIVEHRLMADAAEELSLAEIARTLGVANRVRLLFDTPVARYAVRRARDPPAAVRRERSRRTCTFERASR